MPADNHRSVVSNLSAYFTGRSGMAAAWLVRGLVLQKPKTVPTIYPVGCSTDHRSNVDHFDFVADDSATKLGRKINVGFVRNGNELAANLECLELALPTAHSLDSSANHPSH